MKRRDGSPPVGWNLVALALTALAALACSDPPREEASADRPSRSASPRPGGGNVSLGGACPGGETELLDAAYRGDDARASRCLDAGISPNAVDGTGASAIDLATARNHPEIVRSLLEKQATIVQTAQHNALAIAARDGYQAIVDLLLAAGADPSAPWQGKPPLMLAIDRRKEKIALDLLDAGANASDRDDAGRSPLAAAVDVGSIRLVDALIARGADPTEPCPGGSPLERARQYGSRSSIYAHLVAAVRRPTTYADPVDAGPEGEESEYDEPPAEQADDDPYAKEPPPDLPWPPPSGPRP